MTWAWAIALLSILTAVGFGYFCHYYVTHVRAQSSTKNAAIIIANAEKEAEVLSREAAIKAQTAVFRAKEEAELEMANLRATLKEKEYTTASRAQHLDRKTQQLDEKDDALIERQRQLREEESRLNKRTEDLADTEQRLQGKLEHVAGLSREDARKDLLARLENDLTAERAALVRRSREETEAIAEREARQVITASVQRFAAEHIGDITTSSVHLPSEEMKGRIIGKEGRNIRHLTETLGVDILIDDTPELVVISSYDPKRREIARRTLERLVEDGRIHPAQIESMYEKVQAEIDQIVIRAGEDAVTDLDLRGVAPEIIKTVGQLHFRSSYSQNVLQHSLEMAHIMGGMASELKLDPRTAKRVGLFHDIGKALGHDVKGGHALAGAALLKRHGEDETVVNAVAAHHGDVEAESLYATLCVAADAITAARPGARQDTTQIYTKRLEDLELIANKHAGVSSSYAIQAGRELRVIVQPETVTEEEALLLARSISREIEDTMQSPGPVKVTVVRETRCVEYSNAG